MANLIEFFRAAAPTLTATSVVLAIIALFMAWRQTRVLGQRLKDIDEIKRGMSTQYLGGFPDFSAEIVELLSAAKTSVSICCDVPGYCLFSAPDQWLGYKLALMEKLANPNIDIKIVTLNEVARDEIYERQFLYNVPNWKEWLASSAKNSKRMEKFCYNYCPERSASDIDQEEFIRAMRKAQDEYLQLFSRSSKLGSCGSIDEMSVYFWITDGTKAIFSFPRFLDAPHEHGFKTRDSSLIESLQGMLDSRMMDAREVADEVQ